MKKLLNTRLHLIVLAVSLLITTTILGLSAELSDQADYSTTFTVVSKGDFDIDITGKKYNDKLIFAGQTLDISPTITHSSTEYPAYVFAKIEMDSIFDFDDNGISSDWAPLEGEDNVYYYGTNEGLVPFTAATPSTLFGSVKIDPAAGTTTDATIAITVYALQTIDHDPTSPTAVWGDAQ